MKFIGDFHIHSHYSLATSGELIPEFLDYWARIKGIKVIGTGDFTHPKWTKELQEKTEPAEQGLYKIKNSFRKEIPFKIPNIDDETRFLLTTEISCIYKKQGKVRKVHNVIFAKDFETVEKIQRQLQKLNFNITSDGRPILGMDSKNLLELLLNINENIFFVPAHIWTPWFSVLGDKSGFETIEECFDDLTKYIHAVEMGLSSHPPMNWAVSFLDKYTLLANSDAHSPEKLGRNANILDSALSYNDIINTIKTGDKFLGTVSFFPQEGKYHFDGHRKCNICWSPLETLKHNGICPVCNKKVVVGVMNRVAQLADRDNILDRPNRRPFYSLIPLKEILAELTGKGGNTKDVVKNYQNLLQKAGPEFDLLLNIPIDEIKKIACGQIAEAIRRMRNGEVYIQEGYDGEFGIIKVMHKDEKSLAPHPDSLFGNRKTAVEKPAQKLINFDLKEYQKLKHVVSMAEPSQKPQPVVENTVAEKNTENKYGLNKEQNAAVEHNSGPALIIAGPGTGKTRALTYRIAYLINSCCIAPGNILAVTFTNKAAEEIKKRVEEIFEYKKTADAVSVSTFHALGLSVLKKNFEKTGRDKEFIIIDDNDKEQLFFHESFDKKQAKKIISSISEAKQNMLTAETIKDKEDAQLFARYEEALKNINAFDLDDLVYQPVLLFEKEPQILNECREKYQWMMIDEYQDTNFAQYRFTRLLMPDAQSNLCVIGDPNQAIYGFRGADVKYIRQFIADFPGAKVFRLTKSYRCSDRILKASEEIIQGKVVQSMLSGLQKGIKLKIAQHPSDKSEAEFIARAIENMIGGLRFFSIDSNIAEGNEESEIKSLSDFVVLCRMKDQFKAIEKAFNDHSIPYQVIGDTPFFRQDPVRSVLDILKTSVHTQNNFLVEKLSANKKIRKIDFGWLKKTAKGKTVKELISAIIEHSFVSEKETHESSFKKLMDFADSFNNRIDDFIEFTALGTATDLYIPSIENVTLMTLHAAKGLEFKCVFIAGCEDGLIPYHLFENQRSDTDEEKRLLYVGMTRAEKFLYLTHAERRFILGREYSLSRSPFIDNIEKELIEISKSEPKKKGKKDEGQMSLF
ncbi:MAG: UvrD-helicase domain-containing protein [Bacteroidia bacterium]|nr:UvrD-helicase domain-containing protein [Bacteroidia bacterium]